MSSLSSTTAARDISREHVRDPSRGEQQVAQAIFWGGLAVGVLDITDAMVFQWLMGQPPVRVLHYIASGVVGRHTAYAGGLSTAALGLGLHFLIAFSATAVYVAASLRVPVLVRHALACGMAYGLVVHSVMRIVVLPLAGFQAGRPAVSLPYANLILAHLFFVGLPIGLATRRFLGERKAAR